MCTLIFFEIKRRKYFLKYSKDEDTLHQCVTELCYPFMTQDLRFCTLRWQFLKSLEPPRVAHVRYTDVIDKENLFAQVRELSLIHFYFNFIY